jgi:hypothetical protein
MTAPGMERPPDPGGAASIPPTGTTDQRYLGASLQWLRVRLERLAGLPQDADAGTASPADVPAADPSLDPALAAAIRASVPPPGAGVAPADPDVGAAAPDPADDRVARAAEEMAAAAAADPPPALVTLAARLGLSPFEQQVLLLCIAMELDPRIAELCAAAQGDHSAVHPTFALAFELFDEPAWDIVTPGRPLRYWRLIEISQPNGLPLTRSILRADERIVSLAMGINYLDDRLEPLFVPLDAAFDLTALSPSQHAAVDDALRRLRRTDGPTTIVDLVGPDGPTKRIFAAGTAWAMGRRVHTITAELLPAGSDDLETLARLWDRESLLLPVALLLDAHDLDPSTTEGPARQVTRFINRSDGLTFLATRDRWSGVARPSITIDAARPTPAEQRDAWHDRLTEAGVEPAVAADVGDRLAGQFRLDVSQIGTVASTVVAEVGAPSPELSASLWRECLGLSRPRLDALSQRVDVRPTWDDFVLAEPDLGLLHQLSDQVAQRTRVYESWGFAERMNRGLGISALFAGASGTGKSMAAEVIAAELQLDLYRIDLSAVVSKYIGETEKNLRRLFDAAEDGGALLFFDEADALFGKRSEVKDSHDRYANIEVNYLLQRMESYRGLAILATNMRSALDTAFVRRIRFIVNFPFPSVAERRTMWTKVFPAGVPRDDLDWDRLASLPATGGMIHNIALNAAFMAAHRALPVSMEMVLEAARTEFRKQDLPIIEPAFAWTPPAPAPAVPPAGEVAPVPA